MEGRSKVPSASMEARLGKSVHSRIKYEILPLYIGRAPSRKNPASTRDLYTRYTHTHMCTHTHANRNTHVYITRPDTNKERSLSHSLTTRCCLCLSPRTTEKTPKQLVDIMGLFYLLLLPRGNYSLLPFPPCESVPMESLPHTVPAYVTEEGVFILQSL